MISKEHFGSQLHQVEVHRQVLRSESVTSCISTDCSQVGPFTSTPEIQTGNCTSEQQLRSKVGRKTNFTIATETTPLMTERATYAEITSFVNSGHTDDGKEGRRESRFTEDEDDKTVIAEHSDEWSNLRVVKTIFLSGLIVCTLVSFFFIEERQENWSNVAPKKGEPVCIRISEKLDIIFPIWTVKARSAFIPKQYANLSESDVFFSIVRLGPNGTKEVVKGPYIDPVAPSKYAQHIDLYQVEHAFIMGGFGIDSEGPIHGLFNDSVSFQLEIATTDEDAVSISVSVSSYSELSLRGIILASIVLVFLYVLIIFEVVQRTLAAMIGATVAIGCLTIIRDRPSLEKVISWLDVETLCLLFGMMVMVAILCETGFFDWVAVLAFRLARGQIWPMIMTLCLFTAFLSAFLDNVTTILLMTPVTIRLCEIKNIDPKHVLIALVILSNIGGAATPVGDPPNVIIISSPKINQMGVDFAKFTYHLLPGIIICVCATLAYLRFIYRDISKLLFQEPPETIVGKKRLMEYLKDEVDDFMDSVEKNRERKCEENARQILKSKSFVILSHSEMSQQLRQSIDDDSNADLKKSMELKHEIDVWKKACHSISGYSRDENSVRGVLKRKVMQLEKLLHKKLYDTRPSDDDYKADLEQLTTKYKIRNKPLLIKSAIVMAVVIVLFFLQSIPHLDLSLGWIAILGAIVLLILADFEELECIIARVEWSTLIFFAALFVVMEALSELKLLWYIGQITQEIINNVDKDNQLIIAITLILWVSALSSSLIDNIPFATVMVKIVEDLSTSEKFDVPMTPLVYALAFGACLGGNGTLIGASANVVCAGVAEQHGYRFTFMDFFKVGFPVMILTTAIANVYLIVYHVVIGWT